jgi:hypothetical protein
MIGFMKPVKNGFETESDSNSDFTYEESYSIVRENTRCCFCYSFSFQIVKEIEYSYYSSSANNQISLEISSKQYQYLSQKNDFLKSQKSSIFESFKHKAAKRENMDKTIVRRFKSWLKTLFSSNPEMETMPFWTSFLKENLVPPFKIEYEGEILEFRSFNTTYLRWLFNHDYSMLLYQHFFQKFGDKLYFYFIKKYFFNKEQPLLLKYIKNFAKTYSSAQEFDKNVKENYRKRKKSELISQILINQI